MSKTCKGRFSQQIQRLRKQLLADRTGGKTPFCLKISGTILPSCVMSQSRMMSCWFFNIRITNKTVQKESGLLYHDVNFQ